MNKRSAVEPDDEIEGLRARALGLIDAYATGAILDSHELQRARGQTSGETVLPGEAGYLKDGIYHVAE